MIYKVTTTVLLLISIFSPLTITAQTDPVLQDPLRLNRPTTSQRSEISQKIGIHFIKVNYGRPNVKGRKIFGGLLEWGKIWRVGADYQTKVTFERDYQVNGKLVKKGEYVIYAKPNLTDWKLFLNKDIDGWGQYSYDSTKNVHEFTVKVEKAPEFTETLSIGFMNTSLNKGELFIQWENTRIRLDLAVSETYHSEIKRSLNANTSDWAIGYRSYLVSEYMFQEIKDHKKALALIDKAIDMGVKVFYTYYLKGEILLALGEKDAAVENAKEAKKTLFKNFSNPEWENKIDHAINTWSL